MDIVKIILSAFPWLPGAISTATVVITAKPYLGIPIWMYVVVVGFMAWVWHELEGKLL